MLHIRQACMLLLLFGACGALPQYPGQGNIDDGLQQQQGGLIPVTSQLPQCASHQDCVPYFQCVDGYINTDGSGLLDLRVQPKGTCSQPDYPDSPAICCNIPGVPQQPPFVELCPFQSQCVPEELCTGTILDATNNMVPYAVGGSWSTCGDSNIPGVCCKPPHLEVCPFQSQCVPEGQCSGTILDATNNMVPYAVGGSWSTCGDSNLPGVCCKPPHLEVCPFQSQCVPETQCAGTILDAVNNMVPYAAGGSWSTCGDSNLPGVCCKPPHLEVCPFQSQCVPEALCAGTILDATNNMVPYAAGGSWSTCGDSIAPGVCCKPPHLEVCPFQSQCVPEAQCAGTILDATNNMIPYAAGGSWSTCGDSNVPGLCCKPPHLEVCPFQSQCVSEAQCAGTILDAVNNMVPYAAGGSWSTCGDSNISGVCCKPPHLEVCPFQSQCVPEGQCSGTILDNTNNMVPYVAGGSWSTCGDSNILGVCCKPPHLDVCPIHSQCVQEGQCQGNILDNTNTMVPYAAGGSWSTCGDSNIPGVCCEPPRPAPLVTCPGHKVCVSLGQCDAAGNIVTDGSGLFDLRTGGFKQCFVQQTNEIGLCCNPPTTPPPPRQVLDVCPLQSACMPEILCQDKILDHNGVLVPYTPGPYILKSECALDGNPNAPGVCCLNTPPEYPAASQCGVRNDGPTGPILDQRIQSNIAYNEAQFAEFPWQAIIFFSNFTFKCGASLIGDRWLLTAAHCVNGFEPYDFKIRLGEWQVNTFDEPKPYVDVDVVAVTIHPQFNPKNVHNDIAVLQLAEPVQFQYHINSICLPSPDQTFWGQRCIATGWGKDSFEGSYQHIMKKVDLPTVEHQQCQNLLRKTRVGQYYQLDDSFMCAGGEDNKDACKGDGGGPLACQDPSTGQYVLTGITAFGIGCGTKDVPGVYADVQALLPFVQAVLNGNYDPNIFNQQQQEPQQPAKGYGK